MQHLHLCAGEHFIVKNRWNFSRHAAIWGRVAGGAHGFNGPPRFVNTRTIDNILVGSGLGVEHFLFPDISWFRTGNLVAKGLRTWLHFGFHCGSNHLDPMNE